MIERVQMAGGTVGSLSSVPWVVGIVLAAAILGLWWRFR